MRVSWPKVQKVVNHGKIRFKVDARIAGEGERRFFDRRVDADTWAHQQRVRRANEGIAGATIPERLRVEAVACQKRLDPYGASLTDAVDFFLKHAKPVGGHKLLSDVIEEFLDAKEKANRRPQYIRVQKSILGVFDRAFPVKHVHEISTSEIEKWLHGRKGSLRTRRNYQNDLRNFFNYAVKHGYTASNPVLRLEEITLDDHAVPILSVEQAKALLAASVQLGGAMTPFVAIGLFAGLRTREIVTLDWKEISMEEKTIAVLASKAKTRSRRIVTMSENLVGWLTPHRKKEGNITPKETHHSFRVVHAAAKITPWPRNAMRHSFASYHLAAHRNESLTQAELGHESGEMLIKNYREIVRPSEATKWWEISP